MHCSRCESLAGMLGVEQHHITGTVYNLQCDSNQLEEIAKELGVPKGAVLESFRKAVGSSEKPWEPPKWQPAQEAQKA